MSHSDFEQRRAIAAVRLRLFGKGPTLDIGRYRIEARLGAGGMGEVYLGYDAALERKVAVKRVRGDRSDAKSTERLHDEARALARLSHTNVVHVYEVGEHEGQTFLAMEYVEGTTLAVWLKEPRSWQVILDVFLAAGRGLAAAHSAGVIHRDFKPDNVLISTDGRVCVADFGLALAGERGSGVAEREVAGTVRYMSLEQLRGENVDARSDQFSFCIALYEALWQQEPFDRASVVGRVQALEDGQVTLPPRTRVPRGFWQVVRRGLERDPDKRWPSFDELLSALEAIPIRRRRRVALAMFLPLSLAMGWAVVFGSPDEQVCTGIESELEGVWDDEVQAELVTAFGTTEVAHAAATLERVEQDLDAWAEAWTIERRAQCEAARSHTDDEELARARRTCLERQRRRVEVLTTELGDPDVDAADRAIEAVARLPTPSRCSIAELLEGPEPPPADQLERVEQLRLELAEARSLRELGRSDLVALAQVVEDARALDHPPLIAEALAEQGHAEIASGSPRRGLELLDEAARLALASEHPRLLAETWTALLLHRTTDYPEPTLAGQQLGLAEAAWARLEVDPGTRSQLSFGHGRLAQLRGEHEVARDRYREALEQIGPLDAERPAYLGALAEVSEADEQLELREQALHAAEAVFGPDHPHTAVYAYNLASALLAIDRRDQADALLDRAATIWTHAHREPHPNLARAHLLLASEAMLDGELDRAEQHARAMATIQAESLPSEHPDHGDPEMLLGRVAGMRGDRASALAHASEALRHWERGVDPMAPHVLQMRLDIASSELGLGEFDRAQVEYERVLDLGDPVSTSVASLGLAELALRQGRFSDAHQRLREIEALGLERLGEQQVAHAVLDVLTELRTGCKRCSVGAEERIAAIMHEWSWTADSLAPWLVELAVTPTEAEALGLPLSPADK